MAILKTKLSKFDEVNKLPQNSKLHEILSVRNQIEQLSVDNVDNANNEMKPIFKLQNDMMNKIRATIALIFMEYASKGALQLNKIQRTNITTKIFKDLESDFTALGQTEADKVTNVLSSAYKNTYDKNSSILNLNLNTPAEDDIKKAVNTKIDGKLFSERIWTNKTKTVNTLKKLVINVLNGNMHIDDAGKQITKIFGVTANESYRLLVTEIMRVQAEASINIAKDANIKTHMWSAKFEHTCEFCQGQDGKIYAIDDAEAPEIPAHPYCKCIWINIPPEDNNESLKYNDEDGKIKEIRDLIKSGKQPLGIELGKQGKHILGHNNYIEGRSYLTISEKEAQEFVNKYAGTGTFEIDRKGNVKNKELIIDDKDIGVNIDNSTGEKTKTNRFYIHYSKKGTHIVPTLKGADKE